MRWITMPLCVAVVAVGCGGDTATPTTTTSANATTATTTAATTTGPKSVGLPAPVDPDRLPALFVTVDDFPADTAFRASSGPSAHADPAQSGYPYCNDTIRKTDVTAAFSASFIAVPAIRPLSGSSARASSRSLALSQPRPTSTRSGRRRVVGVTRSGVGGPTSRSPSWT